jgi:hypothetical protein
LWYQKADQESEEENACFPGQREKRVIVFEKAQKEKEEDKSHASNGDARASPSGQAKNH